jgi:ADP-ribosylglycohydrolase
MQIKDKIKDKIKGIFFGQAIGDALGLGTEFLTKAEIKEYYPYGYSDCAQIIQDKHRSRWAAGDWTDDTAQFLCICDAIIEKNKIEKNEIALEILFAQELYKWFKGTPMGIGKTVYQVLSLPQYTLFPFKAAELVWKLSRKRNASNGAIMRTSIIGSFDFWDYEAVVKNTEKIAKTTHWDSRAIGSCVLITAIIAHILNEDKYLIINDLLAIAAQYDERIIPYIEKANTPNIEDLDLEEKQTLGYTLNAMSAGLWAYFQATDFESGLLKVIHEGGDTDTNASVAGSLLGAKFGFAAIPKKYIEGLIHKKILEEKFELYFEIVSARMGERE